MMKKDIKTVDEKKKREKTIYEKRREKKTFKNLTNSGRKKTSDSKGNFCI